LSGHFHQGFDPVSENGFSSFSVPSLCVSPFRFALLDIAPDGSVRNSEQELKLPDLPFLCDLHVHTPMAWCSENLDMAKILELADLCGLPRLAFAEHSGHMFWSKPLYRQGIYDQTNPADGEFDRSGEYFALLESFRPGRRFLSGFEIDVNSAGQQVILPGMLEKVDFRLGAVHFMDNKTDPAAARIEFMRKTQGAISSGIDVLAHPFRAFRRSGLPCPEDLFEPVAEMLRAHGVAAEINYHTNDPELEFFALCLKKGVKLSFGTDSHNLYEVAELSYHLDFVKRLGVYDRLSEVLYTGPADR